MTAVLFVRHDACRTVTALERETAPGLSHCWCAACRSHQPVREFCLPCGTSLAAVARPPEEWTSDDLRRAA